MNGIQCEHAILGLWLHSVRILIELEELHHKSIVMDFVLHNILVYTHKGTIHKDKADEMKRCVDLTYLLMTHSPNLHEQRESTA